MRPSDSFCCVIDTLMGIANSFRLEPLSQTLGKRVINSCNLHILDLDVSSILKVYQDNGALLFRDFENDIDVFTSFSNQFSDHFMDYTGGVYTREAVDGNPEILEVTNNTDEIPLHGEMYYQKTIPGMLWFYCTRPASESGETIVCDGRLFYEKLSQPLKTLFSRKKLKYRSRLEKDEWMRRYGTSDLQQVKKYCKDNNIYLHLNEDNSIDISFICSAVQDDRYTNCNVYINSLLVTKLSYPGRVVFEDDSEIGDEIIDELLAIAKDLAEPIAWQEGDILMIDNTRVMHGRNAFDDTNRTIGIRLCSPVSSLG